MMTAALELKSISKTYQRKKGKVDALRDVSLKINQGEVFGFVGPNGAGKSTTIKVILDIIRDYKGEALINGVNARRPEARAGVAYLPESPAMYEQFTPLEILKMSLRMYGVHRSDEEKWCWQWLERLSIASYANQRIRQLSKGNVQRVALAHALVVAPKLLILDEPLSGLDPVGRKDVINILEDYKSEGGAIFFTSHVLHDVERIADRFGFINHGELVTIRSPQELMHEHAGRFCVRYSADLKIGTEDRLLREGEYEVDVSQSDLPSWIANLNAQGGKVISVKSTVSLEALFFRILKDNA